MSFVDKVHAYLAELGYSQQEIDNFDSASVYIAEEIAIYSHRNQKRVNGENYFVHPYRVMNKYRDFVGIIPDDYFCVDEDLLVGTCKVPFSGVQEVCLLHDVLEDTDTTFEEIREFYDHLGIVNFFDAYIAQPLKIITHDDKDDYQSYIEKVLTSSTASMVKFLDLIDNMNPATLNIFSDRELNRIKGYAEYAKKINDKWHFIENVNEYFKLKIKDR